MPSFSNDAYLNSIISLYNENNPIVPEDIVKYFNEKNISVGSKVSQLSSFKKILKNIREDVNLNELRMPPNIRSENKKNQMENQKKGPVKTDHSSEILKYIKSNDVSELYTALLLASGRRPRELYLMAQNGITRVNKRSLLFKHQIKQHKDHRDYTIPLLVSFNQFNKALLRFKIISSDIPQDPDAIYNKFKKRNVKYMEIINNKLDTTFKSSDLRKMYGKLAYEYAKKQGSVLTYNQYVNTIFDRE